MDVRRAALSRERMAACPPKSVHFQAAEGHTIGLPFSLILLFGKKEVSRALTLIQLRSTKSVSVRKPAKLYTYEITIGRGRSYDPIAFPPSLAVMPAQRPERRLVKRKTHSNRRYHRRLSHQSSGLADRHQPAPTGPPCHIHQLPGPAPGRCRPLKFYS